MINFSFIVLYHDNNSIDYVIKSILNQFIAGDQIIVVNDHSKSSNLDILNQFEGLIQIVHSDKKGNRGYNRNFGSRYAANEYLLFVDGDIIFLPNTILLMRESMQRGNVGAVGNVVCSSNTIPQMNLVTGLDYLNLVQTNLNWETIVNLGLLYDPRQKFLFDKIALNNIWEYFYTAYCAVKKDIFDKIGGFETNFIGWGVEDDELGYRLHMEGPLEYNQSAYGVHAPHMRDLYKCLVSNRINLYRFLAKFPLNELELHMTFGNSVKIRLCLEYIREKLMAAQTTLFRFPDVESCICINELTQDYPCGYVQFEDVQHNRHILELYGLALPFKNKNFEIALCSENLFIYPEAFCVAILSEMLRVSNEIHIIKVESPKRIIWDAELTKGLARITTAGRIVYASSKICDFDIIDCGNYYKISDGIVSKLNDHFVIEENFYHPEYFKSEQSHYILINLTNMKLTNEEKANYMEQYEIIIDSCYDITIELPETDICLSKVLYGDLYRIHTRMIYLIPLGYHIRKDDKWWDFPFRQNDLIIQKM